jgi:hypothetical protein
MWQGKAERENMFAYIRSNSDCYSGTLRS